MDQYGLNLLGFAEVAGPGFCNDPDMVCVGMVWACVVLVWDFAVILRQVVWGCECVCARSE